MAAKTYSGKKPENMKKTVGYFLSYMGRHKRMLFVVAVLVSVSALCNLLGTYMIRPVVNGLADGNVSTLLKGVLTAAGIFATGALAAWGYSQTMVKASQRILFDIRRDLFSHIQTLPLKFFDTNGHGDIMSLFTNDIDTISDALNNSFAMVIQSFIQMVGTLTILYVLNWRLSIIVTACYGIMLWYIRFSGGRSKVYYAKQQNSLGALNSYIEEMISGQKVVKVFNHEEASFQEFCEKKRSPTQGWYRGPRLCGDYGSGGGKYFLYQLCHCGSARRPSGSAGKSRLGKPCQLSGVCPPGGSAHQSVHPAEQLPSGCAGGCGACV